jgi:RNA binding exosome subunit
MAINEEAKGHYDNAIILLTSACSEEASPEQSHVLAHLADVMLKAADFAVRNHALIKGIDESVPATAQPGAQPPLWGGPPLPPHIAQGL